mmetsp:Transcript_16392/g.42338  ORF Transcript_16392/g.42338 Transcript_16392/m.42338 type:complete len:232 (-) Transcript_16392:681-1376(-)
MKSTTLPLLAGDSAEGIGSSCTLLLSSPSAGALCSMASLRGFSPLSCTPASFSSSCSSSAAAGTMGCTIGTSKYEAGRQPPGTMAVISVPSGAANDTLMPGPAVSGTRTMSTGGLTSNSSPSFLPSGTVSCNCEPSLVCSIMRSPASRPSGTFARKPSLGPSRTFTCSPACAPSGIWSCRGPCGPKTHAERVASCRISGTWKQMSTGGVHSVRRQPSCVTTAASPAEQVTV